MQIASDYESMLYVCVWLNIYRNTSNVLCCVVLFVTNNDVLFRFLCIFLMNPCVENRPIKIALAFIMSRDQAIYAMFSSSVVVLLFPPPPVSSSSSSLPFLFLSPARGFHVAFFFRRDAPQIIAARSLVSLRFTS